MSKSTASTKQALVVHETRNDLPKATREAMIALLNQQLADTSDLFSQVKQAHWNIKGPQFIALHKLFDDFAEELLGYVDEIAERAVMFGGRATGTARMAAAASRLPEFPDISADLEIVAALADRYAALAASTRAAIDSADEAGDADTADLLTGVSRGLDKALWFLEAHLQS
ncbi:MAG: DNA starvation/stationary phase protection protein Dps [Anaerolineales bacterium]|nr:DNA starvation/stationary phase protection protein Dps [Anaerolineales bacterium]